jgi:hypothetical protein
MPDLLFSALALAVIYLAGTAWSSALIPKMAPARVALVSGIGLLLGLLVVPLLMRVLDFLSISFSLYAILAAVLVCAAAGTAASLRFNQSPDAAPGSCPSEAFPPMARILAGAILALIAIRFGSLSLEVLLRPLFPFDATMHWATKSRVWFEHAEMVPFVSNDAWLQAQGVGVYTDHHPDYPATIPLLQVWMSVAIGEWREDLINLPWVLCFAGLGLCFYGCGRVAGVERLTALVFTYMLLSLPLLNTHIALAGYADVLLGSCFCAATMALHCWSMERRHGWGFLAAVFAVGCLLIKNEGLFWFLSLVLGLIVILLPARWSLLLLAASLLGATLIILFLPGDLVVAGHSLDSLNVRFHPRVGRAIVRSVGVQDNWHLLGYLLITLPVLAWFLSRRALMQVRGIAISLAAAALMLMFLYFFTNHYLGALRFTSLGRLSLHLAPSVMFLCMLLWSAVYSRLRPGGLVPAPPR